MQHKLEKSERYQDMIETELREAKAEIIELRHKLKVNQSDHYVSIEDLTGQSHQQNENEPQNRAAKKNDQISQIESHS